MVLSQVSSVGELLAIWEQFPGFADFFNPEDRRKQVALFAGALVAGKAEAFLQPEMAASTCRQWQ
jgi:hypothetical protein